MTTKKQTAANQANAQLSTGPRTEAGKAKSAQNSTRHGFTSRDLIIPADLASDFDTLQSLLLDEVQPNTELEHQFFRQFLRASWNLFRLDLEEARLFNESGVDSLLSDQHATLQRYRRQQERSRSEALKEIRRLQTDRAIRDIPALEHYRATSLVFDHPKFLAASQRFQDHYVEPLGYELLPAAPPPPVPNEPNRGQVPSDQRAA